MIKEEKECNSVSAGFNLLVRGSLEIVRRLLIIVGKVVLVVLNAIGHMLERGKLNWNQKKGTEMNINDFAVKVAKKEGGKKSVNIAQIKEILKVVNVLLKGEFYKLIRKIK